MHEGDLVNERLCHGGLDEGGCGGLALLLLQDELAALGDDVHVVVQSVLAGELGEDPAPALAEARRHPLHQVLGRLVGIVRLHHVRQDVDEEGERLLGVLVGRAAVGQRVLALQPLGGAVEVLVDLCPLGTLELMVEHSPSERPVKVAAWYCVTP